MASGILSDILNKTSSGGGGGVASVSASAPLASSGGANPNITITRSSTSVDGYLAATDFVTFNNKQPAGSYITALTGDATATGPGSAALTLATVNGNVGTFGTASATGTFTVNAKGLITAASSTSIQIAESQVTNLVSDLAGKQATGNYITALTGDVTAAGPGSVAATLATVNGNVGTFGGATAVGTFTVNAKGLITAASSTSIQIAESQVTNLVSDLAGKQATGNYITALTGDVTAAGPGSVAATIAVGAVTDAKGSLAVKPASTVVATTNQALTGTPTIDGVATAAGSIILLSAQTTTSQNGPWVAAAGAWSRPTWYPSAGTTQAFQFITTMIRLGTVYQGSVWRMTTAGAITIDTTGTTWVVTPKALNTNTVVPGANNTHLTTQAGVVAWTPDPTPYVVNTVNSNTTVASGNTYLCDTSGGAFNLTLFAPVANAFIIIKDKTGTFGTNNLTVIRFATEKIEGLAASKVFQTNWGSWSLFSDGTDWYIGPF